MKKIVSVLLFLQCVFSAYSQKQLNVVPTVQEWHYSNQTIPYKSIFVSWSEDANQEQTVFLKRFKQELKDIGIQVVEKPNKQTLSLFFETKYQSYKNDDAYKIQFDRKSIISISSYNALVFSTRTILQLCSQNQYKNNFPKGVLKDFSNYKKRMVLLDVARKFFTLDEVKDFIKLMAWVKMNELHLHLSDNSWGGYSAYRLESKLYPELTAKDGHYSWKEIRELQDFAKSYGIIITPEIDSPGHSLAFTNVRPDLKSKWLTPNYLDITNKDTYPFIEEILNEVMPHFDAPDFHLGTDEYRISSIKDDSLKYEIGDAFRKYINYFNLIVKRNGKTTRIWSGFEHMPGNTQIDKDIIIDMWETSDAKDKSNKGYNFINSTHFYTYIVPGAPYYGVDNKFVYEEWTPEIFSNKAEQNLQKGSPGLLGSKMHIWNDFGPTGYTSSEIARLSFPTVVTFSEKMWGTKGYDSFTYFEKNIKFLMNVPNVNILNRSKTDEKIVLSKKRTINLVDKKFEKIESKIKNIEYPWTLSISLKRTKVAKNKEVLLSSKTATVYSELEYEFKKKKEIVTQRGIAIVRANQTEGDTPLNSHRPQVIVFDYKLPLNKKVTVKIVGDRKQTSLFVDGKLIGTEKLQMLCPLEYLGSEKEEPFQGDIYNALVVQNKEAQ